MAVVPVMDRVPSVEMFEPMVVAALTMATVAKVAIRLAKTICKISFDLNINL